MEQVNKINDLGHFELEQKLEQVKNNFTITFGRLLVVAKSPLIPVPTKKKGKPKPPPEELVRFVTDVIN